MGMEIGWIFMGLFWVLAIFSARMLFRRSAGSDDGDSRQTPIDIRKEPYVKGEVGKGKSEKKCRDIES